jgi:hypothetical protein
MFVLSVIIANSYHPFAFVVNVFRGIQNNPLFCIILIVTSVLQAIIVQFGSVAFHVSEGGLSGKYWGISLAFGAGALPFQQFINLLYRTGQHYSQWRMNTRLKRNYNLQRRSAEGYGRPMLEDERYSDRGSQRNVISAAMHLQDD